MNQKEYMKILSTATEIIDQVVEEKMEKYLDEVKHKVIFPLRGDIRHAVIEQLSEKLSKESKQ